MKRGAGWVLLVVAIAIGGWTHGIRAGSEAYTGRLRGNNVEALVGTACVLSAQCFTGDVARSERPSGTEDRASQGRGTSCGWKVGAFYCTDSDDHGPAILLWLQRFHTE